MNQKGFTLIEMLIVLLVISVLLIITIPNIVKQQGTIRDKGCDALEKMVQGQVQAYQIDHDKLPESLSEMKEKGYINSWTCPNGKDLTYDKGTVKVSN
ncbi:prepilin-type N-terminal cleavage/methylation domain-containing protein [Bacillus sp. AGMB 02131]|uniref:ComG operon protein 3 n=1 Tax=Peribacillus faecalis TaxID=2772559 RepID=A0A927H9Z9_9BACI|nr:competence type IV pilus major pilin ComGC [Peribacillus faecalis]MBD3108125.1 prepilin-type N-terminal cleavage/methylation domain-containing protein [Peribacillus faecalis]